MKVKVIYENRAQAFEESLSAFLTAVKNEGVIVNVKFSTIEVNKNPSYSALVLYENKTIRIEKDEKKPVSKK